MVGTRPEAIKMAPVILALKKESWACVRVLATAQHRQMLDQVLSSFGIKPDIDLDIMRPNQDLTRLTARLLTEVGKVLDDELPDAVIVQGDTTSVMVVSLCCFYRGIPIGHVEAGLRTWDMRHPFPEEMNRVLTSRLAHWHFAPTEMARKNLIQEGVSDEQIYVTGNTVIDALLLTAEKNVKLDLPLKPKLRLVLITIHRRENFGEPIQEILKAIALLAKKFMDVQFLYPVHPNPNVKDIAYRLLEDSPNVILCKPLDYVPFVTALKRSYLVITDSGGVQEESPALGKPVLVLRERTERPEAVELGVVKLVGSNSNKIIDEVSKLLESEDVYHGMAKGVSPYGDGHSAKRIVDVLRDEQI
jgi:UDP-N-acetylglucosamine 2-epimerase (non-hydrolysing)